MDDMFARQIIGLLREENKRLRESMPNGTRCPVCDQNCKKYPRSIYGKMAATLILLARKPPGEHHLTTFQKGLNGGGYSGGGDFSKLRYWDLAIPGECLGTWAITDKGRRFCANEIRVWKRCYTYNDELLGFDESETTNIVEALTMKFDYNDLMKM